jgi:hypothetical protein
MFSAFKKFGKLGALASSVARAWSPLSLWPDGILSPGMWISPRTLTSEWQDYTGTTPVAVPGTVADSANPVGLALDIRAGATVLTDPGNHMLQSTSPARPLMSAYDGQTLGPGDTYSSTGFPIAQLYDGVDDGMATAAFSAGTLTSAMDCMIPVRRDSAASTTLGLNMSSAEVFGYCADGVPNASVVGAGSPTVWVDGVQLAGGTSVLQSTMHTAVTVGDFHIVEWRGLDLSAWTRAKYDAAFPGYSPVGARGDIFLYPSTASTEDKDAARQWLADYYGVTLA